MSTRGTPTPATSLVDDGLRQMARQVNELFQRAVLLANGDVDDIIRNGQRDTDRIEHQLDHMLGFCCDPDMLVVFKRLCRYYFDIDPVATAWHINAYREMWDTPNEAENESASV